MPKTRGVGLPYGAALQHADLIAAISSPCMCEVWSDSARKTGSATSDWRRRCMASYFGLFEILVHASAGYAPKTERYNTINTSRFQSRVHRVAIGPLPIPHSPQRATDQISTSFPPATNLCASPPHKVRSSIQEANVDHHPSTQQPRSSRPRRSHAPSRQISC